MGDRYCLTVICPGCNHEDDDVYYAPTCGVVDWYCPKCKHKVDLGEYTGISYEDASNRDLIQSICDLFARKKSNKQNQADQIKPEPKSKLGDMLNPGAAIKSIK